MSSVLCEEQQKLLLSLKKSLTLRDTIMDNIPPRKLLTRRPPPTTAITDMFSDEDPYSSDHFRMYEFKIRRCTRSRSHDWTDCPFAHPGEKARRRDPLRYQYSGEVCPDYRRGNCDRGDACEFSHGVFECWLHPSRYRTEACKDGKNCKRKICFFAHTPRQLRVLLLPPPPPSPTPTPPQKNNKNCCSFCHCCSNSSSPTSTLLSGPHFSSSNSPPLSPLSNSNSKDVHVLNELIRSMENSFNFGGDDNYEANSASKVNWINNNINNSSLGCGKYYNPSGSGKFFREDERIKVVENDVTPDFGWVNELLM